MEKISKKTILTAIILSLVLVFVITGITYAFFGASTTQNNIQLNTVENIQLNFEDNKNFMLSGLIPSTRENVLKGIAKQTNKCIDIHEDNACSLYEFTVSNPSDVVQVISLSMTPSTNTYANFHYMLFESSIDELSDTSTPLIESTDPLNKTSVTFGDLTKKLTTNDSVTYTLVFYIKNSDVDQTESDANKSFAANIKVNSITTGEYIQTTISN